VSSPPTPRLPAASSSEPGCAGAGAQGPCTARSNTLGVCRSSLRPLVMVTGAPGRKRAEAVMIFQPRAAAGTSPHLDTNLSRSVRGGQTKPPAGAPYPHLHQENAGFTARPYYPGRQENPEPEAPAPVVRRQGVPAARSDPGLPPWAGGCNETGL